MKIQACVVSLFYMSTCVWQPGKGRGKDASKTRQSKKISEFFVKQQHRQCALQDCKKKDALYYPVKKGDLRKIPNDRLNWSLTALPDLILLIKL